MAKVKRTIVYTLVSEVYQLGFLVSYEVLRVYPGHTTGRISAKTKAKSHAAEFMRYKGGSGPYEETSGTQEYRLTVHDGPTQRRAWVVREVEYSNG